MGAYATAVGDFLHADRLHPTPEAQARAADCSARSSDIEPAQGGFRLAIERGLRRAEVYNNFAHCLLLTDELLEARHWLDQAIALAPNAPAPYYNRAFLEWKLATMGQESMSSDGLEDIDRAVELGIASSEAQVMAARMYLFHAGADRSRHSKGLDCVARAVELGEDVDGLESDPILTAAMAELRLRADFAQLVAAGSRRTKSLVPRLMDLPDDLNPAE